MNSPDIVRRIFSASECARYDEFPTKTIISFKDELDCFFTETADMREFEYSLDEVLNEILMYISHIHYAEDGLQALAQSIRECHRSEYGFTDGELLATAAKKLGASMLARFEALRMYDFGEGILPYELFTRIGDTTLVLRKALK